jgi:hypothetical protein
MFKFDKIVLELLEYLALVGVAVPFYPWDQNQYGPEIFPPGPFLRKPAPERMACACVDNFHAIQNFMQRHMFRYGTLKNWVCPVTYISGEGEKLK